MNTIVLASNYYGEYPTLTMVKEMMNFVFSGLYTIEAVLMIVGLGFRGYFSHILNIFDFLIVTISWSELYFHFQKGNQEGVQL